MDGEKWERGATRLVAKILFENLRRKNQETQSKWIRQQERAQASFMSFPGFAIGASVSRYEPGQHKNKN